MAQQIIEGTWEEILSRNGTLLRGKRVKVYIESEEEEESRVFLQNEKALSALEEVAKRQQGRRHTDGSQTERIIREGRAGGMYERTIE